MSGISQLGRAYLPGYFISQQHEMCSIPRVDNVGLGFAGASGYQRIVNRSAYNSHPGDAIDSGEILIAVKPYQREPALNLLHEKRSGFSA